MSYRSWCVLVTLRHRRLVAADKLHRGFRSTADFRAFGIAGAATGFVDLGPFFTPESAEGDDTSIGYEVYNQVFTLHGTVMMFLFAVPIFEAVAIFLLPPMLGVREFRPRPSRGNQS